MNKRAEMMFYFVISKSSLNQDEVETSHRLYTRQQIMNKRAEKIFYFVISKKIFYFVISKSSLNQDEVETSHRRRQQIMNKRAEKISILSYPSGREKKTVTSFTFLFY